VKGRVPRTIVGAWALGGAEAGFWLGTAFACASLVTFVLIGMGDGMPPGYLNVGLLDLSRVEGALSFFLTSGAYALVTGWVVGTISGLVIGTVNGLLLMVLTRTTQYSQADPRWQRRAVAALVFVTTAGLWVAAMSPWFGVGLDTVWLLVICLPAVAGAVVAALLSRTLPPVITEPAAAGQA
jgi:hypothetical protein